MNFKVASSLAAVGLLFACGSRGVSSDPTSGSSGVTPAPSGSPTSIAASSGSGSTSDGGSSLCSGTFVFCDDGSKAALWNDYTTRNGSWVRATGSSSVTDGVAYQRARALLSGRYNQFDVTLMGYSRGDSGFGLLYDGTSAADDGYAVLVHPEQFQGVYLKQLVPGQTDAALGSYPLPAPAGGQPFTLRVQRSGTEVTVTLDGSVVLTASDNDPSAAGQLGLLESTTDKTSGAGAVFTLLRVDSASLQTASSDGGAGAGPSGGLPYMLGYVGAGDPSTIAKIQSWLGRPLDLSGGGINTVGYVDGPYLTAGGNDVLVEIAFPPLSLFGEGNDLNDMAQAASGAYDAAYTTMAKALAASPNHLLGFRVGWEMNGTWYPWSNGVGTNATYANYVATFKRVAQIVKTYNPDALAEWCIAYGFQDPTPYWPGAYDAVNNPGGADVISIDNYEKASGTDFAADLDPNQVASMAWVAKFAQDQGVRLALSEYGAGDASSAGENTGPGLNDGTWTAAVIAWMNSLPAGLFIWQSWSSWEPADDLVAPGVNPAEQAAWVSAWGGTHFAGTWWKGTPPPTR